MERHDAVRRGVPRVEGEPDTMTMRVDPVTKTDAELGVVTKTDDP